MISFIILAAGRGSRMNLNMQKCSLPIIDRALINYTLDSIRKINDKEIICVTSYKEDELIDNIEIKNDITFVHQDAMLGTLDAIKCGLLSASGDECFIIPGDSPIFDSKIIKNIISFHHNNYADITLVGKYLSDLKSYGKINYSKNKVRILEANDRIENNGIYNSGVYLFNTDVLKNKINLVGKHKNTNEYYFTDIFKYLDEFKSVLYLADDIMGANTLLELNRLENELRRKIILSHIEKGVLIESIDTTYIGVNVEISSGVKIMGNTRIYGNSKIYANATIIDSDITDSIINENSYIYKSVVNKSVIGVNTKIGPYANIREKCQIFDNVRIGNFVEIKNSNIGDYTKCAHLTYIGDTKCGNNVNFGCGAVTCNYDGKNKNQTIIEENSFIGSNVNLIAPIVVRKNTFIAAGCSVSNDTKENDFIKRK